MSPCRFLRPAGRIVRVTRGLLILLSAVAIFGTIAFIHRMETTSKFNSDGHSVAQNLNSPVCQNCSRRGTTSTESTNEITNNKITTAENKKLIAKSGKIEIAIPVNEDTAAVAAAEIVSPDEALPEEMIPDQESPAFQPPVIKTEPQQQPSPIPENFPQQQEHAQQQESLKIDEQNLQLKSSVSVHPPSIAGDNNSVRQPASTNVHSDNMSRTLLHLESNKVAEPSLPVHSNLHTAKIQNAQIESLRGVARMNLVSQEQPQTQLKVGGEEENLPVLTRSLYQAGHYLPPKDVCPEQGEGMKLMILVTTAPGHAAQREAVRSTWGHVAFRRDVGMAFMVGTSKNQSENMLVQQENFIYGDIIQGRFIDTYNNLTLKTISMLEWSWEHCGRARFLLKTDDDMYIHMPVLLSILDGAANRRRTIMGKLAKKWKPIRNVTSKYYISPTQFKPAMYPDFNTGPAYILTNDIVEPLYQAALNETFFKLEDVFVTGMVAGPLKIQHINYPQFFNRRLKLDTCAVAKLASVHMVKTHEMFDLWKRLSDGLTRCSPK
ncbi:uncharacterized protein LOC130697316 [Daphnia carinata]|uniref:uncharacterized protein LOC130697316 n=1 Tax=Daphnia carinata TaxID=120202 RepID=UPI00257A211C|nr:uncharacterized protein LOC130697316 [Daphnia carinata]